MAGFLDILPGIPPLLANLPLASPSAQSLTTVRLLGDSDPTYGSLGWTPPLDGSRFAVLETSDVKDNDTVEANRIWAEYDLAIFIGIEHADTANADGRYQLEMIAWAELMRQFVASNRRLNTIASTLYPQAGDVRWTFKGAKKQDHHLVLGVPYYGLLCATCVYLDVAVTYQF